MANFDAMQDRMEKKAAESKEYYMEAWRQHISGLLRLVSEFENGLSYNRYLGLRAELLADADATWEARHGKG